MKFREACLEEVDFSRSYLRAANLEGTIFDENQVYYLKDKCNLNSSKVYLLDKKKVISYEEYCKRMIK